MARAQKPDFIFRRNERVHLNWWGRQFSRLLAAEVCASAVVMLDTPRSEVVWRVLAVPTPFASFPFTSPPVRHRVPSHFSWSLPTSGAPFHKLVSIHEKRKRNCIKAIRGFCQRRQGTSQAMDITCTLVFVYRQRLCKQLRI